MLGSHVNNQGPADDGARLNIMKPKRKLVMSRLVLRWKVVSIKTRTKLPVTFVEPVPLYGLSTIVYLRADDNKSKVGQNTNYRSVGLTFRQVCTNFY